jgi:Fe-S cluster assembly protein SufB
MSPKGVHVDIPCRHYFRINAENMGQFERTLIIIDEGASAHYIEGVHGATILHQFVAFGCGRDRGQKGWQVPLYHHPKLADNIFNLVTKRAVALPKMPAWNGSTATLAHA